MRCLRTQVCFLFCATMATSSACRRDHDHRAGEGDEHPHGSEGAHEARGNDDHEQAGGHDHEPSAMGITRWTDKLELFAEHPPAVVGQETPIVAHLTILEGFRPLERARVSLELDGPAPIRASVDRMLRSGIFKPTFTARAPGKYRGLLRVETPNFTDEIDGIEIEVYPSAEAAARANPDEEPPGAQITFLKEQQWKLPFATEFAAERDITPSIEVPGEVATPPSGSAEIGAPIAGRVLAPPAGFPLPGQTVRRGAVLATLAPAPASPESAAGASLSVAEAEARQAAAQTSVARAERLVADRAIPARDLEDARRELEVARAAVSAARQSKQLFAGAAGGRGAGAYRLTSPIDGVLVEVAATAGQSVEAGTRLFRVVDLRELWIRVRVPEEDAPRLLPSSDASYSMRGVEGWLPIDVTTPDATAGLLSVSRVVDPVSRTVEVIYALHAPDARLRVGASVRVNLPAGETSTALSVPSNALVDDDGRDVVYVQVEGETFEERIVRTGARAGAYVAVLEGIRPGERIVTRGANLIRLASRASTAPAHGHVH